MPRSVNKAEMPKDEELTYPMRTTATGKSRQRSIRARVAALIGVVALTMGMTACGGDEAEGDGSGLPPKDDTLVVGLANEQPYAYMDENGEATGFSTDVATAVLNEMGYENIEFQVVDFGDLISSLNAGQFDIIAAGMYLTPDRIKQVAFSDPDYCVPESLAVAAGNPHGIVDYSSIVENPELILAVASGTVEVEYAEVAGIPDEQLKSFSGIDQMYSALIAGEVDAVTGTEATVNGHVAGNEDTIVAVESFYPTAAEGFDDPVLPCGGYAFSLDEPEFRDAFNDQLNEFREDGTTKELITQYEGFTDENVDQANEMTVDDFKG